MWWYWRATTSLPPFILVVDLSCLLHEDSARFAVDAFPSFLITAVLQALLMDHTEPSSAITEILSIATVGERRAYLTLGPLADHPDPFAIDPW